MWYLFVTKKQRSIESNQYSLQVSPLILIDIIKIGTIVTILVYSFLSFCASLTESIFNLGTGHVSKSDEFSEQFQTAFDPPLIFGKLHCKVFKVATKPWSKSPV